MIERRIAGAIFESMSESQEGTMQIHHALAHLLVAFSEGTASAIRSQVSSKQNEPKSHQITHPSSYDSTSLPTKAILTAAIISWPSHFPMAVQGKQLAQIERLVFSNSLDETSLPVVCVEISYDVTEI